MDMDMNVDMVLEPERRGRRRFVAAAAEFILEKKRKSEWVKTWWERSFDEDAYKYRKLNRHHVEADA